MAGIDSIEFGVLVTASRGVVGQFVYVTKFRDFPLSQPGRYWVDGVVIQASGDVEISLSVSPDVPGEFYSPDDIDFCFCV